MPVKTLKADDEVLDVLRQATIDETGLTLNGQLDRALYAKVDKFLKIAGAKWNRKAARHVFEPGAQAQIMELLGTGKVVNKKATFQSFYTPAEVAEELVGWLEPDLGESWLEPSAGHGAIAQVLRERTGLEGVCVELDPAAANVLREKEFDVYEGDFLAMPTRAKYDLIAMNPPFTGNQDIKHVMHAFECLLPAGRLAAIVGGGALDGGIKLRREFKDFVDKWGCVMQRWPAGTFKEAGTNVSTIGILLER